MTRQDRPTALQSQPHTFNQKLPPVAVVKLLLSLINFLAQVRQKVTPPPLTLHEMVGRYTFGSNAIRVAARIRIGDLLKDGPKRSEERGQAGQAQPQHLSRFLRAVTNDCRF